MFCMLVPDLATLYFFGRQKQSVTEAGSFEDQVVGKWPRLARHQGRGCIKQMLNSRFIHIQYMYEYTQILCDNFTFRYINCYCYNNR